MSSLPSTSAGTSPQQHTKEQTNINSRLSLPQWVQEYATWHTQQRAKFPDQLLLTHPDAPKLYIRMCPHQCGGLHDRMVGLSQFLQDAHNQSRILLLKWYNRFELESYLQPNHNLLNWTLPLVPDTTDTAHALKRYANQSSDHRIVVHHVRDKIKVALTPINNRLPREQQVSFGNLWHSFFQPSTRLQQLLNKTTSNLLWQGNHNYAALHLRVRHPANYNMVRDTGMDLNGLPWERLYERGKVIETAIRALECTKTMLLKRSKNKTNNASNSTTDSQLLPLYVFSDSKKLVNYLVHESRNFTIPATNRSRLDQLNQLVSDLVQDWQLVARDTATTNAHLDAPNQTWDAYAGTFVDLYVAMQAQCLSVGIGNFAVLALMIAEPKEDSCIMKYVPRDGVMAKTWGYHKLPLAQVCKLPAK